MGATFTAEQLAVADHVEGHCLVKAVAGSGKTTTLVERVGRLSDHVDPGRITCLMFNKSAQVSFQRKLKARLSSPVMPEVRTYHSMGLKMYKRLVEVGAMAPAKLVTSSAQLEKNARQALRDAWQAREKNKSYPPAEAVDAFPGFITRVKASMKSPAQVFRDGKYLSHLAVLVSAFDVFEALSSRLRVMYYDDLIYRTMLTLRQRPELWALFNQIDHLLVDEFQDTNQAQFEMVQGLASGGAWVCAVGDDDQAIYSFRGSDVRFIQEIFPCTFAPCTHYTLSSTFRYGHETSLLAAHIIARNTERTDKIPIAHPGNPDTRIHLVERRSESDSGIVPYLRRLQAERRLSDSAMLVRYYSHALSIELELVGAEVPYHVYGREPLLFLPEIAAMVAAMSIAENYWTIDIEHRAKFYQALLRTPATYLDGQTIESLALQMMAAHEEDPRLVSRPLILHARSIEQASLAMAKRLRERADLLDMFSSGALEGHPPSVILGAFLNITGLLKQIEQSSSTREAAQEAKANIQAFVDLAASKDDIRAFLDLLGPLAAHEESKPPASDHLPILSLHRAKGLEYDSVFLPGWTDGSFPRQGDPLEEERRLAYVGVTRAIRNLVFIVPKDEGFKAWVKDPAALPEPGTKRLCSPFLFDGDIGLCRHVASGLRLGSTGRIDARDGRIAQRYLRAAGVSGLEVRSVAGAGAVLAMRPLTPSSQIEPGMRVTHEQHGDCTVVAKQYGPVWMLERITDGHRFPDVLANNAWYMAETAAA
jgi:DNA helicase II / ATP-dependent DNA helicase PcrA